MDVAQTPISRRNMIKLSSAAIATLALSDVLFVLSGCSSKSTATDQVVLKIGDGSFYLNGASKSTPFSGVRFSLLPSDDAQSVVLFYADGDGEKQAVDLASDQEPIHIQGTSSLVTVDDTAFRGIISVDEGADIFALCLGGIERAVIQGNVHNLVVAGPTDLHLLSGATVENIILGNSRSDVLVEAGATAKSIFAPAEGMVDDQSKQASLKRVDASYAQVICAACVKAAEAAPVSATEDELVSYVTRVVANETAKAGFTGTKAPGASPARQEAKSSDATEGEDADAAYAEAGVKVIDADSEEAKDLVELGEGDFETVEDGNVDADATDAEPADPEPEAANGLQGYLPFDDDFARTTLWGLGGLGWSALSDFGLPLLADIIWGHAISIPGMLRSMLKELDALNQAIKQVYNELKASEYANVVNAFFADYQPTAKIWIANVESMEDAIPEEVRADEDALAARRKEIAYNFMFPPSDSPVYQVNGEGLISFTERFCTAITTYYVGATSHLFDAYFKLCLLNNVWEHHTIEGRTAFQDSIIAQLADLVGYAAFAIRGAYEQVKDNPDQTDRASQCLAAWSVLMGDEEPAQVAREAGIEDAYRAALASAENGDTPDALAPAAREYLEANLAVDHGPDVSYYMEPGNEVALFKNAQLMKTNQQGTEQDQFKSDANGNRVVTFGQLAPMYAYYQNTYGVKKSYFDILFDENEAGISLPTEHQKLNLHLAVDEPVEAQEIHQGMDRYTDYWVQCMSKDNKHKDCHFAEKQVLNGHEQWKWYDVSAFGVFVATEDTPPEEQ